MDHVVIDPGEQEWETRPHAEGEPARHVTELSDVAGMEHVRANGWRYEPGAAGRRHRHPTQDETFVVLAGTLSMYAGEPPQRRDVPAGSLIHITSGTPRRASTTATPTSWSTSTGGRPRTSTPSCSRPPSRRGAAGR
jgi:quercetin dioxygenase-like cupin family protein